MEFVKYLKEQRSGKRLAIFGDGGSYHNSQDFREYLMLINQ
jgi:phosphoheptose isomerase